MHEGAFARPLHTCLCKEPPNPRPRAPLPPRPAHIFTSQDFSWLQNGHVNCVSSVPVTFFLGGGFRLDLRRPMAGWGGGVGA